MPTILTEPDVDSKHGKPENPATINRGKMSGQTDVKHEQEWTPPRYGNIQKTQKKAQNRPMVQRAPRIQSFPATGKDLSAIRRHLIETLKSPYVKMVHCPECGKEMRNQVTVNQHMKEHTGNYNIRCEICQQGFHQRRELLKHMKKHGTFPKKSDIKNENMNWQY